MKISLMVALAKNGVIGLNNKLPWHLPNDLKYFRSTTMGKPIIMGRKTFDSLGKPLPGRTNIVITRDPDYKAEGAKVVLSLEKAVEMAEHITFIDGRDEVVVIGGAEIYALALDFSDRLYLTEVHAEVDGDVWFPEYNRALWKELAREDFSASENNPFDYSFVVYERS